MACGRARNRIRRACATSSRAGCCGPFSNALFENCRSRREEALSISDFEFRISDFHQSLLTSAPTIKAVSKHALMCVLGEPIQGWPGGKPDVVASQFETTHAMDRP